MEQIHTNVTSLLWTLQGSGVDNLRYVPFPVSGYTDIDTVIQQYQYQNNIKMLVFKTYILQMLIQYSVIKNTSVEACKSDVIIVTSNMDTSLIWTPL